jgi:hypothetical protein
VRAAHDVPQTRIRRANKQGVCVVSDLRSYDDEVRFDFFCKAALEFLLKTGRQPDILHCHDWSTAHVAHVSVCTSSPGTATCSHSASKEPV